MYFLIITLDLAIIITLLRVTEESVKGLWATLWIIQVQPPLMSAYLFGSLISLAPFDPSLLLTSGGLDVYLSCAFLFC